MSNTSLPVLRLTAGKRSALRIVVAATFVLLVGVVHSASAIPLGWVCIGSCGTSGADGVVTAPPSGSTYDWVSTSGGVSTGTQDLNLGTETIGSFVRSEQFSATAGDELEFYFNYVTSDGAGFADYAWARVLDPALEEVALLFTARTTTGGNTVPGFGMPANAATLTPSNTPIIDGGPLWSPLGIYSGLCFSEGCGYTGWILSSYNIVLTGNYILQFGVTDWDDELYSSGLAFAGTTIAGVPIDELPIDELPVDGTPIPEPGTLILLSSGLIAAARATRSRRCRP